MIIKVDLNVAKNNFEYKGITKEKENYAMKTREKGQWKL